jgi:hypothetical protein
MIIIAASLYLPEHLSLLVRRAFYYWGGDDSAASMKEDLREGALTGNGRGFMEP